MGVVVAAVALAGAAVPVRPTRATILVTVKVGDKVVKTLLRVERVNGYGGDDFGFGGGEGAADDDGGIDASWQPFALSNHAALKSAPAMTLQTVLGNLSTPRRGTQQAVRPRVF